MNEIQRVLAAIDSQPDQTIEDVATATGLGFSAVRVIVEELMHAPVVHEDIHNDYRLSITRIGNEILATRSDAADS